MSTESFYSLIEIMIVLFLLLATGFFARKKGIIDDAASKRLSKLIVNIGQPMMIVHSLIKIEYSLENTKAGVSMFALGFGVHTLLCVMAAVASRTIKDFDERKIGEYSLVFANAGFIGFPIFKSIFGDIGEFWGSFYVISFHLFVWTWGMIVLSRGRKDIKMNAKKIFFNLGTIPCFIGIVLYLMMRWIALPEFLVTYTGYLNNLCTPISVLIVGALIATRTLEQIFCDKRMYYLSFMRLIIMPLVICVLAKVIGLPEYMVLFATAAAALPSATNITMFAEIYDIAPGYAAQTVGVTSLFTVVTLPCIMLCANWIVGL